MWSTTKLRRAFAAMLALALLALASSAWLRGNMESRARAEPPEQADASPALSCYQRASHNTRLGEGSAFLLCRGARSNGPVTCYEQGVSQTGLTDPQLFDLCRCAQSNAPVACYERAKHSTFLIDPQIIQLCSAIVTDTLWPNCMPIRR